jgi:hypothetical protein
MRYVRTLGLLFAVVAALTAWASTATATTLTAPGLPPSFTGQVYASAEGHVVLDNPIAKIECASGITTWSFSHGEGITAETGVTGLSFANCTNSWHVTVVFDGFIAIHSIGNGDGTLTSSGATIEATRFGITCRYATATGGTDIGTLTDSAFYSTIDIAASLPFHGGSGLCGEKAMSWTGSYKVEGPAGLTVDP